MSKKLAKFTMLESVVPHREKTIKRTARVMNAGSGPPHKVRVTKTAIPDWIVKGDQVVGSESDGAVYLSGEITAINNHGTHFDIEVTPTP
jgi:hypothetical protein